MVPDVDPRRLIAQVRRVLRAADRLGSPLSGDHVRALGAAELMPTGEAIQRVLDRSCLVDVHINPEMRVKVARGPARPILVEHDWRAFLVKLRNEAGTTATLRASGAQAHTRWLDVRMSDDPPQQPALSGLELEYRFVRLYSHDTGLREASLAFDVGQGTPGPGLPQRSAYSVRLPAG
jgi:hypothetical protein